MEQLILQLNQFKPILIRTCIDPNFRIIYDCGGDNSHYINAAEMLFS